MPTFTETKTLISLKLVPALDIIITEHEVATLKDGVVITKSTEGRSYSNMQLADFEMDIAPTGASLADIVTSFNVAAIEQRDSAVADKATAEAALATAQAQVTSPQAQIDAYTPPVVAATTGQFTSLEYLDLFTEAEQLAVVSATMVSAQVKLWYDKMLAAGFITITDPRTVAGLDALVGAGLMTAERKAAIITAMTL